MAVVEVISKLSSAKGAEKQGYYLSISKLLSENIESSSDSLTNKHIKTLCDCVLEDLKNEVSESPQLVKLMQILFHCKYLQKFFPESEKTEIVKNIISIVDSSQHENVLINCFSVLIQISPFKLESNELNDLLQRMEEILSKKDDAASTYSICCYFQKIIKDYEETLSNYIPVLSKLVFLPLCHPSTKVREIAEKNLDMFPKLLLYTSDKEASSYLIKLVKETYSRGLLRLFKDKQEMYALKVWKHVVNALGNSLHANLQGIMPFFAVIEKGFKSPTDEICIQSFIAWKSLINSFADCDGVLNESKILRFTLKPFKNVSRLNENIISVVCDTWYHLAWSLAENLSNRYSEVCIPLLELTVGKVSNGVPEKIFPKGGLIPKNIKKGCYILLRFLEQPPSESFNRLSSPKKLPNIPYPALQKPLDIKTITYHFKELLNAVKIIIDICGTKEDMKLYQDSLMKSVLYIVSTVIEDSNKESVEAVSQYLNFLSSIIEAKTYPALLCLKCLESLSKLSRKNLMSHCFSFGPRKSQDILCTTLLKLLLSPHLFPSEAPKRFFAAYNRLVQAGICDSFHTLTVTHKFMHIIRNAVGGNSFDVEVLIDVWSGLATPLLEEIEKTQEVNQGDKQEHDFSCMYDVLLFPFEFIFPTCSQQFRTRAALKLWTNLYKSFIRSASLVTNIAPNEACENFCVKVKEHLKEDLLKKPHFFETVCLFMQSIIDSIDFASGTASGLIDISLMAKRKKPLGNLTSFVDILSLVLKIYCDHYIEIEEDSNQSSAPAVQRKLHVVKSAAPLDILKTFFGNLKTGGTISFVLEQLVDPISKLFLKSSQKKNFVTQIDSKLEQLWNVMTTCIERYYLGPYDSEFLTVLSPLLEATFSHPKRHFKEKSRRFWFASFGPNASSLQFPDSLKSVLKKMKLSLLPEDISPTEFSISPMSDSTLEDKTVDNIPTTPKSVTIKPHTFKSPLSVNGEPSKVVNDNKLSPKISIDDLPSEEFVKIDSPIVTTPRRRCVRKRKSYVPSLYNDLSQDTATLMSSSESQDTQNSAPLEELKLKETEVKVSEIGTTLVSDEKASSSAPTVCEEVVEKYKGVLKSPMSAKFEEKLHENLENQIDLKEVITISSSESDQESDPIQKKSENKAKSIQVKNNEPGIKISVFSEPGEKQSTSHFTRRKARLSQSFSGPCDAKDSERLEIQRLNKSCSELMHLSDSDEIIPSSQSSTENENSIKLSINKSKSLSIESEQQKLPSIDESLKNIELQPENCSLPGLENTEKVSQDSPNKLDFKVLTSTPSKQKFDDNEECKQLPVEMASSTDYRDVSAGSLNAEMVNKEPEAIIIESSVDTSKECEMKCSDKEDVKNLNYLNLVVAVDKIGEESQTPSGQESPQATSSNSPLDVGSKSKPPASDPIEQKSSEDFIKEPIAKKTRLSIKLSENNSQNETYSQRLRKKNTSLVAKPQSNLRKRKIVSKAISKGSNKIDKLLSNANVQSQDTIKTSNTEVKSNLESNKDNEHCVNEIKESEFNSGRKNNNSYRNSKEDEISQNISITLNDTIDKISIVGPNKSDTISNKSNESTSHITAPSEKEGLKLENERNFEVYVEKDKICITTCEIQSEKSMINSTENVYSDKNSSELVIQSSNDISFEKSSDEMEIVTAHNELEAESCEIFETLSENSCKEIHSKEDYDDSVPPDSDYLLHTELAVKENSENFQEEEQCSSPSKASDEVSLASEITVNNIHLTDIDKEKLDKDITVIPSSFDDDSGSNAFNNICQKNKCTDGSEKDSGMIVTIKLTDLSQFPSMAKNTPEAQNVVKSDPLSVQFSDTEDEVILEMQNIVESIVDASCESIENSLPMNHEKSKTINQNKLSGIVEGNYVHLDVAKKKCLSPATVPEVNMIKIKADKIESNQFSEDDSSSESSVSNDSSNMIVVSNNLKNETENFGNFLKCSNEKSALDEVNSDKVQFCQTINDQDSMPGAKVNSEACRKALVQGPNHSYSFSGQNMNKLKDPLSSGSSKLNGNDITNVAEPCKAENIDVNCFQTSENTGLLDSKNFKESEVNFDSPQNLLNSSNLHSATNKKNLESSENLPSLILNSNSINEMFTNKSYSLSDENEIKNIIRELIIQVDKLSDSDISTMIGSSTFISANLSTIDKNFSGPSSKHVADKENQLLHAASGVDFAKGSKKRKIKPPIRSPFNFRHRIKGESSKKLSPKGVQSLKMSQMKSISQNKDIIIQSLFPKEEVKVEEIADNSMAKIISSIVDSITENDIMNSEALPDAPSSSHMTKAQRIELSNDELTDLNTRLNASIAPQTRRSKLIAASHKTTSDTDPLIPESINTDVLIVCSEPSSSSLSSILKKRKSTGEQPPLKMRKVTFASPLIHEVVIESCLEPRGIETVSMNRLQNLTKKPKKILQEKNKTNKSSITQSLVPLETEDVPSSSEYQDSDILDFSNLPVSPALINCPDDVSCILKDLTSPSWVRGLESLLSSKNIKTIGDVCKLNIHQVKALPFKSPKVFTLHKALMAYIKTSQDATLEKFKSIDDGSFVMDTTEEASRTNESPQVTQAEVSEKDELKLMEETIKDILKKDQLKQLPMNLLGQLIEGCGKAICEKNPQNL